MNLTTLITACTRMLDPKVIHALIWHQSGGEPWRFSVWGGQQPRVLRSMGEAVRTARDIRPDDVHACRPDRAVRSSPIRHGNNVRPMRWVSEGIISSFGKRGAC